MQVEHKRACPSCGAENALDATYCWKCFATFQPRSGRMPAPPSIEPARRRHPAGRRIAAAVVGVVVVMAAGGIVRHLLRPDYHVPESLPGMQRLRTAQVDDFERRMKAEGASNNVDLEVAVYGPTADPQVYLVLANGKAIEDTDQLFREFLAGAESTGAQVDRGAELTGSHAGAEWRCVPVHAASVTASVCMWREDASVGMTLDLDPGKDFSGALLDAYDASHD